MPAIRSPLILAQLDARLADNGDAAERARLHHAAVAALAFPDAAQQLGARLLLLLVGGSLSDSHSANDGLAFEEGGSGCEALNLTGRLLADSSDSDASAIAGPIWKPIFEV